MNKSLSNFEKLSENELAQVNGGFIGSAIGHFAYFGSKGLREYGKLLNRYYKH